MALRPTESESIWSQIESDPAAASAERPRCGSGYVVAEQCPPPRRIAARRAACSKSAQKKLVPATLSEGAGACWVLRLRLLLPAARC